MLMGTSSKDRLTSENTSNLHGTGARRHFGLVTNPGIPTYLIALKWQLIGKVALATGPALTAWSENELNDRWHQSGRLAALN
jgi:hypothetical protein